MKKKIGIMGGTFDPIHIGHLIIAEKAYEQFDLQQIRVMPAGNPPHKQDRKRQTTDEQRIEMVRRAIAGNPHFALSLEDMKPDEYSYTFRTLERLKEQNPDEEYYFIIGGDSLFEFDHWRNPDRICHSAIILAAGRNSVARSEVEDQIAYLSEKYQGEVHLIDVPDLNISSSMLRDWIQSSDTFRYYVPEPVYEYIIEQKLYQLEEA